MAALKELVRLFRDRVYNLALGFVQNEQDAEEIAQDVFIRAYRHIGQFRQESSLATWLYRITVTCSIDSIRKKKRKRQATFLGGVFSQEKKQEPADFHHPGVLAERKDDAAVLFRAIKTLPPQQKSAFLLQKMEGLSLQQVADVLKTSVSATESLLHRAKANLRKELNDYYQKHYR